MQSGHRLLTSCGIAALSGALYALAYPPLGWWPLVFPGIAGFLIALRGHKGPNTLAIGLLFGFTSAAIGLSWLWHVFGSVAVQLWCVLALFPMVFGYLRNLAASRGLSGWKLAAFTTAVWTASEFVRGELFWLKFPWQGAGVAVGPNLLLPWIGVYGVGALTVLASSLLSSRKWLPALALVALLIGATLVRMPVSQSDSPLRVAGLQFEGVTLTEFLKESRKLPDDIDHVVWPEYAIPYDIRKHPRDHGFVTDLCNERDITLTFGTQLREETGNRWRNIALTIDPSGTRGEHTKVHTVHFFNDGVPGESALPVQTRDGKIGTPVCFDCDYQDVTRRMTLAGAGMFIVPIMDALTWTARQQQQHARLFRIRACENARWMFVCASSGVSQIIDPAGTVHGRLETGKQQALVGTIHSSTKLTFFTRIGWLTPWVLLAAATIWTLALAVAKQPAPHLPAA
ncbi:MAG: apolipoprotein N-acyltransferase [Verrucomicrobiota bacterium JB025]|nr:nitrilase-related carbon-nitrogen hydrolase [Verrucomicrobiota bacterium JB025]